MGATAAVHPADPILQAYGLGKLDDVSSASVSKHLKGCAPCQRRVAELSSDEFLVRLQQAKVMPDKAAFGWSPSATSSSDGTLGPVVAPPPAETLPPELVDHPDWEIIRELGRGGMGVVYLAKNRLMGRLEVLKVVGRHMVERPGVLDRFLREIQSAAKLQHANIVTAYTAIRLGPSVVLAMEYVEGLDLAKMVKAKGPLPVAHACYFIHQAALGLQHAHERGMVHRDIKPANLILARDGKKAIVKVLDFGLAKVTSEGQADSGLTREGQMLGTPDYIAPEQIRDAQSADIRADIYSLGCTFYYLLTGGPPFRVDHLWDLYTAHFSMEAGPLNLVRPEVPVELAAVVAKMMAKDPRRRFQTPAQVAQALVPFFRNVTSNTQVSSTEVSDVGRPAAQARRVEVPSVPAQPATNLVPAGAPPVEAPPRSGRREPKWESLIEFKETEALRDPAPATIKTAAQKPKWLWPAVAGGLLPLALFFAWAVVPNPKKDDGYESTRTAKKDALPGTGPAVKTPSFQESISNSIGMTLRLIPAGEFLMGSPDDDKDAEGDEKPRHRVRITRPFYLGEYEVTQAQYKAVMGNNLSWFSANGGGKDSVTGLSTDRYPVETVSWLDAVKFCNKLGELEGLRSFYEIDGENVRVPDWNRAGYRLPTEAEWEYACRASASAAARYSFGDDAARLGEFAWYDANSESKTHPVGEKRQNGLGLFDMHGNVWEWCWDGYGESYYRDSPEDDPRGLDRASGRVIRGGSWHDFPRDVPRFVRSACRFWFGPGYRNNFLGFRLALVPSGR